MTQTEYEQNRAECWEQFCKDNGLIDNVHVLVPAAFACAFDRAYALGKLQASCRQVKETISQEEIECAAEEFAYKIKIPASLPGALVPFINVLAHDSYLQGAQDFIGKQEKAAEESSLWNRLTDEEKRELRCRYHTNECVISNHRKLTGDKAQTRAVARMRLLENLFGKENLKTNNND